MPYELSPKTKALIKQYFQRMLDGERNNILRRFGDSADVHSDSFINALENYAKESKVEIEANFSAYLGEDQKEVIFSDSIRGKSVQEVKPVFLAYYRLLVHFCNADCAIYPDSKKDSHRSIHTVFSQQYFRKKDAKINPDHLERFNRLLIAILMKYPFKEISPLLQKIIVPNAMPSVPMKVFFKHFNREATDEDRQRSLSPLLS